MKRMIKNEFQQVLEVVAGSWTDANHPTLKTQKDVNRYLARFRARFRRRQKKS